MADIEPTRVRSLSQIVVQVGEAMFNLNMVFDKRHSLEVNMTNLEADFVRKVAQLSSNRFFSVTGEPFYNDETAETIFVGVIMNPYMEDQHWPFPTSGTMGLVGLEDPTFGLVNNGSGRPQQSRQGSSSSGKRRKPTDVRILTVTAAF